MFLFPFLIEPFQKHHLKTNICHLSIRCPLTASLTVKYPFFTPSLGKSVQLFDKSLQQLREIHVSIFTNSTIPFNISDERLRELSSWWDVIIFTCQNLKLHQTSAKFTPHVVSQFVLKGPLQKFEFLPACTVCPYPILSEMMLEMINVSFRGTIYCIYMTLVCL